MFTIYVGKYNTIKDSKKDEERIRKLYLTPHLFSKNGKYTLQIAAFPKEEKAKFLRDVLANQNLDAYIL